MAMRRLRPISLALWLVLPGTAAAAGLGAPVDEAGWSVASRPFDCQLSQAVPRFGMARFRSAAGAPFQFLLDAARPQRHEAGEGRVALAPPAWRHDMEPQFFGTVSIQPGGTPVWLDAARARRLAEALEDGREIRLRLPDAALGGTPVELTVSPVGFARALADFQACAGELPAEAPASVNPTRVHFAFGSTHLDATARERLDRLVAVIGRVADQATLEVHGHADEVGSVPANDFLSLDRALAVKAYLVERGLPEARIATVAHGERAPVAGNDTAEGRARNRRVRVAFELPEAIRP